MKFPFCFLPLTLVIGEANLKADPVFDIPKLSAIKIDGQADDWVGKGFQVGVLADETGRTRAPQDFDPSMQLGWDDAGLLVMVKVKDDQIAEADETASLWSKDSIEFFLGSEVGKSHYYRVMTGTGADAKFPSLRKDLADLSNPPLEQKLSAEAVSGTFPGGYEIEARLPWATLGVTPKAGSEVAFQICVNDADSTGPRLAVSWNQGLNTHRNPKAMNRLRLSDHPSDVANVAVRTMLDGGRPRIEAIAPAEMAGKNLTVAMEGQTVATSRLELIEGHARTTFLVPPGLAEISGDGLTKTVADCRGFSETVLKAMNEARLVFKPSVFSGETFPQCDFEQPVQTRLALGNCAVTSTFYDADFREVKTAAKPGRYGAIVEVQAVNGKSFKRFQTLYRTPGELNRRSTKLKISALKFPKELGIDQEILAGQMETVSDLLNDSFFAAFSRGSDQATVLAGLSEMKVASTVDRTGVYTADQKWWHALKKRTGNLRQDYYVHLPESYAADSIKKWPLLLFLHGSGERGYDLNQVKDTGLPHNLDTKPDFPFIVIAPQCSPGEWWSPFELNELLDKVEAKYRVDVSRVYLTGLSMGGYGSWALATESPERFAAVVPICGGGEPAEAGRIKNIPIWVFHGAKDNAVPLQNSQEMVDALKALGSNVKFTIFPDAGHDSWTAAYAMPELYDWLLQQRLPDK